MITRVETISNQLLSYDKAMLLLAGVGQLYSQSYQEFMALLAVTSLGITRS